MGVDKVPKDFAALFGVDKANAGVVSVGKGELIVKSVPEDESEHLEKGKKKKKKKERVRRPSDDEVYLERDLSAREQKLKEESLVEEVVVETKELVVLDAEEVRAVKDVVTAEFVGNVDDALTLAKREQKVPSLENVNIETYADEKEDRKDFILLQIHVKRKNIDSDLLEMIGSFAESKKTEKKGVKQVRGNIIKKGGISFEDFSRIAHADGYTLSNVWWRDDTEYVDGELKGEVGVAIGFSFNRNGLEDSETATKVLRKMTENRIFHVDFHLNPDGSTVMSAFGGQEYRYKNVKDKKKRQVLTENVAPVMIGDKLFYMVDKEGLGFDHDGDVGVRDTFEEEDFETFNLKDEDEIWAKETKEDLVQFLSNSKDVDRKTIGARLKSEGLMDENGVVRKELRFLVKEMLGKPEKEEELLNYLRKVKKERELNTTGDEPLVEKKKGEVLWDDQVVADLEEATLLDNKSEVRDAAWKRLNERGYFLNSDPREQEVFDALDAIKQNRKFGSSINRESGIANLKNIFGVKDTREGDGVSKKLKKEETKNTEHVTDEVLNQIIVAANTGGNVSNIERDLAFKHLEEKGISLSKIPSGDRVVISDALEAFKNSTVFMRNGFDEDPKRFLKAYFEKMLLGGEGGKAEVTEKAAKAESEKKESRRMEIGALFAKYEKISGYKDVWKKWKDRIEAMAEGAPEREYAIKQLQATMYLYNNPMERLKHPDYWRETGMAILRDIQAKEV